MCSNLVHVPDSLELPFGVGVTAESKDDAFLLIDKEGIDPHKQASRIKIQEGISINNLDQTNIAPNIGPIQFRGVWYSCQNMTVYTDFSVRHSRR